MNENVIQVLLKKATAEKAPAAEIDLWPAIESRLEKTRLRMNDLTQRSGTTMNTHQQPDHQAAWLPRAVILAVAIVLVFGLFLITPQGRTLAQGILHFFHRTESNLMPGPTATPFKWVEQTPGVPAVILTPQPTPSGPVFKEACGTYSNPKCTIEEIRAKVSFRVFELSTIPDGLYITGATGGPNMVHILYQTKDQSGVLIIDEEPWTGNPSQKAWDVGASADIQTVTVGGITAEYVKGSYDGKSNPPEWNPNLDVQFLRWVNQGTFFTMSMLGREPKMDVTTLSALIGYLTDGQVAAVNPTTAEKPTQDPIADIQKGVDYVKGRFSLSVEQAEQQSGIKIHLPTRLPDVLTLQGARYEPEQKWVIIFYLFDQTQWGPNTDGLGLSEQLIPDSGDCYLCGFVFSETYEMNRKGSGAQIGKDAKVETVQIGNAAGQYVEGVWNGTDKGWVWDLDPYMKTLRWQSNGMAFQLSYMGMGITKEDMIAIAKSIK